MPVNPTGRATRVLLAGACLALWSAAPATAQQPTTADVDLADVFGTTVPSDTPGKGDRELAHELVGRFGRADGTYRVLDGKTQLGFGLTDWFAVTPGLTTTWASISNVTGLETHSAVSVTGAAVELKVKLFDRNKHGLGLALLAEPALSWLDGETGDRVRGRGVEFRIAADWAAVPQRLFIGVNIAYGIDSLTLAGVTENSSGLALSAAMSWRFSDAFFLGVEARHERAYDGFGLGRLQGHALFIGPTLFFKPSEKIGITATWSPQVFGHEAGASGDLDLVSFERHQAKVKVAIPF